LSSNETHVSEKSVILISELGATVFVGKKINWNCGKIPDWTNELRATLVYGFEKKCDLDIEMAVDLIKERDNYDTAVMFSGGLRYELSARGIWEAVYCLWGSQSCGPRDI
jgi:hypothetical protein